MARAKCLQGKMSPRSQGKTSPSRSGQFVPRKNQGNMSPRAKRLRAVCPLTVWNHCYAESFPLDFRFVPVSFADSAFWSPSTEKSTNNTVLLGTVTHSLRLLVIYWFISKITLLSLFHSIGLYNIVTEAHCDSVYIFVAASQIVNIFVQANSVDMGYERSTKKKSERKLSWGPRPPLKTVFWPLGKRCWGKTIGGSMA